MNRLHDISEGEIVIDGKSITAAKGKESRRIRRDIGMIFQNFNLVKRSSVLRNVLAGRVGYHSTLLTLLGRFPKADVDLAFQALDRVGIVQKAYARRRAVWRAPASESRLLESSRRKPRSYWRTSRLLSSIL